MFENIDKFVKDNPGFELTVGEIGICRPCVGIQQVDVEAYVGYEIMDDDYNVIAKHAVAKEKAPERAYHKGDYLAVLYQKSESTEKNRKLEEKAMIALNDWLGEILKSGYKIQEQEKIGLMAQVMGSSATETHKVIVDK